MEKWTALTLAKKVLEEEKRPLTAKEIWEIAKEKGYNKLWKLRAKFLENYQCPNWIFIIIMIISIRLV